MYEYLEVPTAVTMCPRRRSAGCTSLRTSLRSGAAAIAGCAELTDSEAVLPELDEVGERLRPVAHERAAGVGAALRIPELAVAVGDVGVAACPEHEDRNPLVHRVTLVQKQGSVKDLQAKIMEHAMAGEAPPPELLEQMKVAKQRLEDFQQGGGQEVKAHLIIAESALN